MQDKALILVGVLAIVALVAANADRDTDDVDRLSEAQTGAAMASMSVHAAVLDGADGGAISTASAKFQPTTQEAATIAPAPLGFSFKPLVVTSQAGTCGSALWLDFNPTRGSSHPDGSGEELLEVPEGAFDIDLNRVDADGRKGSAVSGGSIQVYRVSPTGTRTLVLTGTTDSYGDFDGAVPAMLNETYVAKASKSGFCGVEETKRTEGSPSLLAQPTTTSTSTTTTTTTTTAPTTSTTSTTTTSGPAGGQTGPSVVYIPVGITGTVQTKNLAQPVTLSGSILITTPAGRTFNQTLSTVTVPSTGGAISGFGGNYTFLKSDIGTGRTTMRINVRADSVDHNAMPVGDAAQVTMYADTDYTGEIRISISPASFAGLSLWGEGYGTKTLTMKPSEV